MARYYFNLNEFYFKVDMRCNVSADVDLPRLYKATKKLDNVYETEEDSGLWLLETKKFRGGAVGYEYNDEFATLADAQEELKNQFYEAVADQMYNL